MKKSIAALLICLLSFTPAFAQEKVPLQRLNNELDLSYGRVSLPSFAMVLGGVFATAFTFGLAAMDDFSTSGAISVGYYNYLTDHFAVGGDSCFENMLLGFKAYTGDSTYENKLTPNNVSFSSLMPGVKLSWFNRQHFGMYTKLNAGACMQTSSQSESGGTSVSFAMQVDPVAMEFGGTSIRGFLEVGFGMEGLFNAGIRYAF